MNSKLWNWDWVHRWIAMRARIARTFTNSPAASSRAVTVSAASASLANSGLCRLNGGAAHLDRKTIIVIGVPRGGTSMIAGALHAFRVYLGDALPPLYEDRTLGRLIETRNHAGAARVVSERNTTHDTWGFKHPSSVILTRKWHRLFREPVYVVVFRDVLAVANRRAVSREKDTLAELPVILAQYNAILGFLKTCDRPAFLVSYEKALLNPGEFTAHLAAFIGIDQRHLVTAASRSIQPSPEAYHAVARHRADWAGYLDIVTPERVVGWAFRTGAAAPVTVHLTIDGRTVYRAVANLPRPDVRQHFRHITDRCGFVFQLPSTALLQPGDTVSVRLEGVAEDINNSPQRCP